MAVFQRKTVDSILSTFTKAVDDLRAVAAQQEAESARLSASADAARSDAIKASTEASRALGAARRIEALTL